MKENKSRSIGKSISWRVLASCDTILISYLITGSIAIAATIGSIEVMTKMVVESAHYDLAMNSAEELAEIIKSM